MHSVIGLKSMQSSRRKSLGIALTEAGIGVQQQVSIRVWFRGRRIGDFKADMLADGRTLLELKAARGIDVAYEKQLLNYLRATDVEVGLLLNFGVKPEFRRLAFENLRKVIRVDSRKSAASEGCA